MEWRIFFIGPMGSAKPTKSSANHDDYSLHIPKLHSYFVDRLVNKHGYILSKEDQEKRSLGEPLHEAWFTKAGETIITCTQAALHGGDRIPTSDFDFIDDSDLVIADLSGNSPSVVYELALSHALGIRTIAVSGSTQIYPVQPVPVRAFLSHASGDKPAVRKLYHRLKEDGFDPWLDERDLLAGDDWKREIERAVREAGEVLVCLSKHATDKEGFLQKEIKFALDKADEKPEGKCYIIPVKLEECVIPERLSHWQSVNLFDNQKDEQGYEQGYEKLAYRLKKNRFESEPGIIGYEKSNYLLKKEWFDYEPRVTDIDFQSDQIFSSALDREIDTWFRHRNKRFDSINPLTNFYGVPLPDISSATGLAAGFYDNFARPILANGRIVERMQNDLEKVRELKGLIVLNPEGFNRRINTTERNLWDELCIHFSQEVKRGSMGELFIQTREGARIPFFLVEDYMIDIPRTLFSLALSPRLRRSTKSKKDKSLRENMERLLVGRFFEAVKGFIVEDRYIGEELGEKFHYGTIEEIPEIIKTGKSKTWA